MNSRTSTEKAVKEPKRMTLKMVKDEVRRLYGPGDDDDSEAFQAGIVLLSSLRCGPDVERLVKFTKIPAPTVRKFAGNLEASRVWSGGKVYADWFNKDGGVAFLCDTLVAQGLLRRS